MKDVIGRSWLLMLSAIFLGVMVIFSFSQIAWKLGGRRDQDYPEFIFMLYGLPTSLIMLAAGGWIFFRGARRLSISLKSLAIFWFGVGVIFALGAIALLVLTLPERCVPTYLVQFVLDNYLQFALPFEVLVLIVSCGSTVRVK